MNVLGIGTDERIFDFSSAVRVRQEACAARLGTLELVILSKKAHAPKSEGQLRLRAAVASNPLIRLLRAWRIARNAGSVDVVTSQDPFEIGIIALFVSRYLHAPLHVQMHTNPFDPEFVRGHWPLNRLRVLMAGFVLRRAKRVRVVSERAKDEIIRRYRVSCPISVLPIYIDTNRLTEAEVPSRLSERLSRFKYCVLVVSRLEEEKNVALAIESFAAAAPTDACLVIVGDGKARRALEESAVRLGIGKRVFFEGYQDSAPYYGVADLVLVPSKYEGYGLVIVEALAAGKPVLSTDVGVAREAGAVITTRGKFADALSEWFERGPRTGELRIRLLSASETIEAIADDMIACVPSSV